MSGNAFLANLGHFIIKIFWGSMPPDLIEGQNNSPRRFVARKKFLGQVLPPSPPPHTHTKPSYGPNSRKFQITVD